MRMMMKCSIPVQAGNKGIVEGTLPKTMMAFIEKHHPEGSYFFAENGKRTAMFIFDLKDPSMIPSVAEPFFLHLDAEMTMVPVMNAEDMKAGVERAAKQI